MGPDNCEELVSLFRNSLKVPKIGLLMSRRNLGFSYDAVRKSMLAADCKEEFCRQLSDQLVLCEKCGERPILYNVIRDEDRMKRHLCDHKLEHDSQEHKENEKHLSWTLKGPLWLPYLNVEKLDPYLAGI